MEAVNVGSVVVRFIHIESHFRILGGAFNWTVTESAGFSKAPLQAHQWPVPIGHLPDSAIDDLSGNGLRMQMRIVLQMEHPVDGAIWHTYERTLRYTAGRQPETLFSADYQGRPKEYGQPQQQGESNDTGPSG